MRKILSTILLVCATSVAGYGEENPTRVNAAPDSLSYDINPVVVTATRTPLRLKNTPVITRVITARDIERLGVATIQEALQTELAGVEFHQAGYGSSVSFQGLDARYVLFLLDGERLAGETYGNIDYSRIPLNNIERIEIVRGASSVLYGSNAMGAVVNIITRAPRERIEVRGMLRYGTPFQKNGGETLNYGTDSDRNPIVPAQKDLDFYRKKIDLPNAVANLSIGTNLGKFRSLTDFTYRSVDTYRVTGTRDEQRHYDTLYNWGPKMKMENGRPVIVNGQPVIEMNGNMPVFEIKGSVIDTTLMAAPDTRGLSVSGSRDINVAQRFDYELSPKFRFQVSGAYFNKERYDFQTSIMDDNPMSASTTKTWKYDIYEAYNVKGLMEHSPGDKHKVYLSYSRDEYIRRLNTLNVAVTPKQRHILNNPRLLWTWRGEVHRLTTGLEFLNEGLNFDLNPEGYDAFKTLNSSSLYVQDEIWSGRTLSFVAGIRGDYNPRFGGNVTPKLSAKYNLGDFALRAGYSRGYRTPSIKELYMDFLIPIPGDETYIRGNDGLTAETNNYFSVSGEFSNAWINASVTLYKSYFRDKIDVIGTREEEKNILRYQNVDRSELSGVEVILAYRPFKGMTLTGNYNYVHTVNDAPAGSTQYIYPSPHTATFQFDYGFAVKSSRFGLTYALRYVGPKNYDDFMTLILTNPETGRQSAMYTGTYTSRHGGYSVSNAAVHIGWRNNATLTLGVDNLFNYRPGIVNFNSAVLPPRNYFAQLVFAFGSGK